MQHLKSIYKPFAAALVALFVLASSAGVPVKWTAETSRVHPEIIVAWRGDTLNLACTLKSYGQPVSLGTATASFMWQTNGMGNAWWQTNATVSADGVIRATWSPAMDPGAGEVAFFMPVVCADGASYRAAGRIRFRPSPGAGSQTIDLPQPGGTLDFGAYQLVNAPWATLEAVDSAIDANNVIIADAITSATGAIVIPPPVDLGPYATTGMVAAAVQESGNALAGQISAVSNAAMQRAEMGDYATHKWTALYFATNYTPPDLSAYATRTYADSVASNAQATAIAAIPSLAGYATQSWAANYFATNYTPPDLSAYATRTYADSVASSAQATALAAIPSLAGYATEQYVGDYFANHYTPPDLSSYASRSYADAAASNAQATALAAIPSLAGYATEQYVGDYFATNYTQPDLSSYASRSYADAAASNAQATAIAAIPSLTGYATETYAQNAAEAAASDALNAAQSYARDLSWAASEGNTRLVSPDGMTWQDATGTVWQVSAVYGWSGTVVDIATTVARPIVFTYYGTTTNAPNMSGAETDYWSAGGGTNLYFETEMSRAWLLWFVDGYPGYGPNVGFQADGDPTPPATATNLTFTTSIEFYSLSYQPVALATNPVDRVLYESSGGGGSYNALTDKPQINGVTLGGTNNTAVGLGLLGTNGGTINGPLQIGESDKSPITFDFDAGGTPSMTIRDSIGNFLGLTGNKLFYQQYDAEYGAELFLPTNSGTLAITSDIPAPSVPSAPEVTTALRWRADGTACVVTVAAGGTLTADTSNWTEGQAVMAIITLADGAGIEQGIELVGYGAWPVGTPFVACCYRVGMTVYVVPSVTL